MQDHLEVFEKKYPCCDSKQCRWNWQCMAVTDPDVKTLSDGRPRCPKDWEEWHKKAHAKYLMTRAESIGERYNENKTSGI